MEPFILQDKEYFTIKSWCEKHPQLAAGFSTKNGGLSEGDLASLNIAFHVNDAEETVRKNRRILADKLHFPMDNWVSAEQTHKITIKEAAKADKGKGAYNYESAVPDTDGFFTLEKGVLLTLCYADCVPLYFFHPKTGAIGIAHAGWKGTVLGIAKEMIEVFRSHGIDSKEVQIVIGPSITEQHYIVDSKVIGEVDKIIKGAIKPYKLVSPGQYQLNLQQLNRQILVDAGAKEEYIQITGYCTSKDEDYFFSHRRDRGKTGRMMSFIGWREDEKAKC
ncbi:peptidoglycan editing factor PgeF [Niallia sp. NCCP-28]|uniref:peptidoglycan editing factor PgeF n=1 Tax=Niallia sp. NCCP-28 TaxID=2934712 RepID=UPI00208A1213|nr:peptidoglycan editing factor PgeF [Niallia sp. NCCP-28]GKU82392.1 laccase domain protein [Niallia sp. NCCP-28]